MTFSDLDTARRIHASCVPTWVNVAPSFHDCDPGGESNIWSSEPEVFATKNVVTFFATPDLRVFDYLAGYWHPSLFGKELDFVERVRREALDAKGNLRPDAGARLGRAHAERARELASLVAYFGKEKGWSAALGPDPVQPGHRHTDGCRWSLVNGLDHLREVHADFARDQGAWTRLPRLARLLETYRYGNEFAEGNPEPIGKELRAAMRGR
ncbi:MAG TPA: hypothetical protein VFI25_10740 [Planctomycetota bacterium]|nr:hypothetical protein [Planctomycetota bacterium]